MILETERLVIRNIVEGDLHNLKELVIDFNESEYWAFDGHFPTEDDKLLKVIQYFNQDKLFYSIYQKDSDAMLGYVCFHNNNGSYDLGYCFHSKYKRKGYGKESCIALIQHHKNEGIKEFTSGTAIDNLPSVKLLESLGFECISREEVSFHKDENGQDIIFMGASFVLSDNNLFR